MTDREIVNFVCYDGDRRSLWPYHPPMVTAKAAGEEDAASNEKEVSFDSPLMVRAIDYALEAAALCELVHRHDLNYILNPNGEICSVRDFFVNLSRRAGLHQIWLVSSLLSIHALIG